VGVWATPRRKEKKSGPRKPPPEARREFQEKSEKKNDKKSDKSILMGSGLSGAREEAREGSIRFENGQEEAREA